MSGSGRGFPRGGFCLERDPKPQDGPHTLQVGIGPIIKVHRLRLLSFDTCLPLETLSLTPPGNPDFSSRDVPGWWMEPFPSAQGRK